MLIQLRPTFQKKRSLNITPEESNQIKLVGNLNIIHVKIGIFKML